jgi:hypothetical protein
VQEACRHVPRGMSVPSRLSPRLEPLRSRHAPGLRRELSVRAAGSPYRHPWRDSWATALMGLRSTRSPLEGSRSRFTRSHGRDAPSGGSGVNSLEEGRRPRSLECPWKERHGAVVTCPYLDAIIHLASTLPSHPSSSVVAPAVRALRCSTRRTSGAPREAGSDEAPCSREQKRRRRPCEAKAQP